ncbi:hypothetical protein O6H91_22G028700 [Diphasiastrum complanatum]|uniref:Uncharacterized protein n=2 Tax=Diphasiastrum complanatum TaxID=34168 RepID=A0ACC2AE22_DIPCM|nr:hypothetical protein O6H91_Y328400 [Diphasiastrum complanatum]KAJ7515809.1 hypothetical protein O6H91_22G028700 [Diphasiastrum complanatum]KAJ7515810.1 hypothetical protein O6H91_22G028700 [Diphasiastrum complanatum]
MKTIQLDMCTIVLATFVVSMIASVSGQLCSTQQSFNGTKRTFSKCQVLGSQSASIAWSLDPTTNQVQISFSGQGLPSSGWVGWGLNPSALLMAGTSALIAFKDSQGKSTMLQYKLTAEVQDGLSTLSPGVTDLVVLDQAVEISGTQFQMFATLQLKPNQTSVNLIWNRGPGVSGTSPEPHNISPTDLQGRKSIDLSSGIVIGGGSVPYQHLKNTHGLLAAISWGLLLPLGAMAARYLRAFDPAWFYIHVSIQTIGYLLGVVVWCLGLRLGHDSPGIVYHKHRRIGITLFCFATLQVLAIAFRPGKEDKIRVYWKFYHGVLGFTTIILAAVNIFKGLDILLPGSGWRTAYIVILSTLGGVSIILEIITWSLFFRRKTQTSTKHLDSPGAELAMKNATTNGYAHKERRNDV